MIPYATPFDCVDIVPSLTEVRENSVGLETALQQSLLDASRLFEADVMAPENFFAPTNGKFEVRTVYGNGTEYIRMPPFTEIEFVTDSTAIPYTTVDPDEYRAIVPFDDYSLNYFLKWNWGLCGHFFSPTKLLVSAKWGFKCIPADVTVAVKNMGCLMFLLNSSARLGQNTEMEDMQETRLRNTYNRIVQSWQDKRHHIQLGVG
jgi:hypothetical protein